MSSLSWQEQIGRRVHLAQIIVVALLIGCLVMLMVAVLVGARLERPRLGQEVTFLTFVGVLISLAAVAARLVVPALIVASARQAIVRGESLSPRSEAGQVRLAEFLAETGDAGRLWLAFLAKTSVACALLEGPAFLCLVAYMFEQTPLSLAIALGLMAALVLHFPTRSGVIHWIENQLEQVAQQRQLAR